MVGDKQAQQNRLCREYFSNRAGFVFISEDFMKWVSYLIMSSQVTFTPAPLLAT